MNFILSATTNLFLCLIFLLMIWLIFSKVRSSRFVGYNRVETFIIVSHPVRAKKRPVISFSPFFSSSFFNFLVLALSAKHRSHVSTKSGYPRDYWYPVGDAIVVMSKVRTCQLLIKRFSYSQWETYIGSLLHSCKLGRLICQYHYGKGMNPIILPPAMGK